MRDARSDHSRAAERATAAPRRWEAAVWPTRWGWYVELRHGAAIYEGGHWSPTRERAEAWALRRIEKLQRREDRRKREAFTVAPHEEPRPPRFPDPGAPE